MQAGPLTIEDAVGAQEQQQPRKPGPRTERLSEVLAEQIGTVDHLQAVHLPWVHSADAELLVKDARRRPVANAPLPRQPVSEVIVLAQAVAVEPLIEAHFRRDVAAR